MQVFIEFEGFCKNTFKDFSILEFRDFCNLFIKYVFPLIKRN